MSIKAILALVILCAGCGKQGDQDAESRELASFAESVFLNGGIYTLDQTQPWAEAAALMDGEIVYVGDNQGARRWIGPDTREIDLSGMMLLPGFHDSHVHLLSGGVNETACNLLGLVTLEESLARLQECAAMPGRGEDGWILGGGWDRMAFPNGKPSKAMLDEIFGHRPVALDALDGHTQWVSSRTLELAGIDRDTPDPDQGIIDRDPLTGEATGLLEERAMDLANEVAPELTLDQNIEGLAVGISLAHGFGITSIIEPGIDDALIQPYLALSQRGELTLRVLTALSPIGWIPGAFDESVYEMVASREQYRGPNLNPDSVKIYIDGVLENGTALLVEPYLNPGDDNSQPFYSRENLEAYFQRFDREGLQIHAHAIGDQAVRSALDAFEAMRKANGPSDNRHHIVHLQLIHSDDVARFGELGITATFQSYWAWPDSWITDLNAPMVGQDRVDRMYPIASVLRTGGRIAGGSDWFVSSLNPLQAIEVALRRQNPDDTEGAVLNEDERVDLAAMLAAYTIEGAYLMSQEQTVGSIEAGKRADLVVLDRNLFEIPVTEINQAKVVMTLFDGNVVYPSAHNETP